MIENCTLDKTLKWASSSCVRHYLEGRQDGICVISEIKSTDETLRKPYNIWEEGGFRLEVVNKPFQEWSGLKTFSLEDWDKPVFQIVNSSDQDESQSESENSFDALIDNNKIYTFTELYHIIMQFGDSSKMVTLKMIPLYSKGEVEGSKF